MNKLLLMLLCIFMSQSIYAQNNKFEIFDEGKYSGVRNNQNKIIIPAKYQYIQYLDSSNTFILGIKGKTGLTDSAGILIIPFTKNTGIYSCLFTNNHVITTGETNTIFNILTKKRITLSETESDLFIYQDTCNLEKGEPLIYEENKLFGVLLFPDNVLTKAQYSKIYHLGEYKHIFLMQLDTKYCFYNTLTDTYSSYFSVTDFYETLRIDDNKCFLNTEDFFPVMENNKWYLRTIEKNIYQLEKFNETGFKLPYDYTDYLLVKLNGKYGYISIYGYQSLPFIYDDAHWFVNDVAGVKVNGKYMLIDIFGNMILPPLFDYISETKNNKITTVIKSKEFDIDEFGDLKDPFYPSTKKGKTGYLNSKKEIIIDYSFHDARDFYAGMAAVNIGAKETETGYIPGKWGFINFAGETVIPVKYDDVNDFSNGIAAVKLNGKWGFINHNDSVIIDFKYQDANSFYSGVANVKYNDKRGCINMQGEFIVQPVFESIGLFFDSLAVVKLHNTYGYINKQGKMIINNIFDEAKSFSDNLAAVKQNNKWGFINRQGQFVIPAKYDKAENFYKGKAEVQLNGTKIIINEKGEIIN